MLKVRIKAQFANQVNPNRGEAVDFGPQKGTLWVQFYGLKEGDLMQVPEDLLELDE